MISKLTKGTKPSAKHSTDEIQLPVIWEISTNTDHKIISLQTVERSQVKKAKNKPQPHPKKSLRFSKFTKETKPSAKYSTDEV